MFATTSCPLFQVDTHQVIYFLIPLLSLSLSHSLAHSFALDLILMPLECPSVSFFLFIHTCHYYQQCELLNENDSATSRNKYFIDLRALTLIISGGR